MKEFKMKKGGKWIQKAIKKPGSFTAQAKRAGMSVPSFREKVLANKDKYSSTTVKRANLAKTLSKMRKGQMGMQMPPQNQPNPNTQNTQNTQKKKKPVVPNYKPHKVGIMSIKLKRGGKVNLSSFLSGKNKKCK